MTLLLGCMLATILPTHVQSRGALEVITRNTTVLSLDWSADEQTVVYTQVELGDPAKFDPSKVRAFTFDVEHSKRSEIPGQASNASFTFDGMNLILTSNREGKNRLYRYSLLDGKTIPITPEKSVATLPACSPTEDLIAFCSGREGDDIQIYLMQSDGSHVTKLTNGPGKCYNPSWSQDGKKLAYYREIGDHKDQVFVAGVDGSGLKHVSNPDEHNFYPAFLPSGDLSYANMVDGKNRRLIIVDIEGELKSIWPYDAFFIRWSKEGRAAFIAGSYPRSGAYVSDPDGANPVKISL